MKTKTVYQCELCGKEYCSSVEAISCEASHLHLSKDEYAEYLRLQKKVEDAKAAVLNHNKKPSDSSKALKAVIDFENKYGIKNGNWVEFEKALVALSKISTLTKTIEVMSKEAVENGENVNAKYDKGWYDAMHDVCVFVSNELNEIFN